MTGFKSAGWSLTLLALVASEACDDIGCHEGERACLNGPCDNGGCQGDLVCSPDKTCVPEQILACEGTSREEGCFELCLVGCAMEKKFCGVECPTGGCGLPGVLEDCMKGSASVENMNAACTTAPGWERESWCCPGDDPDSTACQGLK